jgi:hypothetical protein
VCLLPTADAAARKQFDEPVPSTFIPAAITAPSAHTWLVLGSVPCKRYQHCTALVRSGDSGRHWRRVNAPAVPFATDAPVADAAKRIVFANERDGWIYGGSMWSTHDGGVHWQRVSVPSRAVVSDVAISGGRIYVLAVRCTKSGASCRDAAVLKSGIASDVLRATHGLPRLALGTATFVGSLSPAGSSIYLSAQISQEGRTRTALYSNAGGAWGQRRAPCNNAAVPPRLAAHDLSGLYAICSAIPGAGQQLKHLYASKDGGRHWRRRTDPPTKGYASDVAAPARGVLYLASGRGAIAVTRNGGSNWSTSAPIGAGDGWGQLVFVTPKLGIALPWNLTVKFVAVTHDGGRSWPAVRLIGH